MRKSPTDTLIRPSLPVDRDKWDELVCCLPRGVSPAVWFNLVLDKELPKLRAAALKRLSNNSKPTGGK